MSRGIAILLREILESIELIDRYTAGMSFEQFTADVQKQDAVVRRLAIIGEAAKRIPEHIRSRHPSIPWRDIAGARDIMIHEYFRVDLRLAWDMLQTDLPDLAVKVREVMRSEDLDVTP